MTTDSFAPIRVGVMPIAMWSSAQTDDDSITYVDIGSLDRETKTIAAADEVSVSEAPSRARQILRTNDVLVSTVRPNLNAVALVPEKLDGAIASTGFTVLRANPETLNPRFLFHWVRSRDFVSEMISMATGASYPAVSDRIVLNSLMPMPSPDEQRRIADVLDKADAIRRKRKEVITITEDLMRSAFLEMFGDPVTNPKGWDAKPLGEIGSVTDGTHKTPRYLESGVPFLSAKNVRAHRIDWKLIKYISEEEHRELIRRCKPTRGDVLLTKSGTIGESAVVDRDTEFSLFESVALIKVDPTILAPTLLASAFNHPSVRKLYGADVKGVGVKHLHLVDIRRLPILLPPRELQQRFMTFASRLDRIGAECQEGVVDAETLFDSLVQRAFLRKRSKRDNERMEPLP